MRISATYAFSVIRYAGILGVAADRDRAGDVLVDQAERSAEQVDAGGDERRTDAVVVEHERLDQIVGVALVIRRVDDAVRAHGADDVLQVLVLAFDLPEDRIQRMLQRAVELVALRRPQLVEVGVDSARRAAYLETALRATVRPAEISSSIWPLRL